MRLRFERWMTVPLAGAAIAAALAAWSWRGDGIPEAPARALPAPPGRAARAAWTAPIAPAPAPVSADALPLRAQVERLLATHAPEDAFRAYVLVADCASFNADHDRLVFDPNQARHAQRALPTSLRPMTEAEQRRDTQLCGQMTERERQARLDYLAIALQAGVPGAAVAFANEGPFGDPSALETRPDDPLVREWKVAARAQLTRAAESGTDFGALNAWAAHNFSGTNLTAKNPALAYRYTIAVGLIQADMLGTDDLLARVYAPDGDYLSGIAAELTPEQRAAELAAARRIADLAKEARKRARGTLAG